MTEQDLGQTASEKIALNSRGYKFVKKLGEGSYAKVYLSLYRPADVPSTTNASTALACKVIDTNKAPADFVRKFLPRELDILVRLNHPYIVLAHSIFQRRSKYYIFMRYAENGDLLEFILRNGHVAEAQARVWLRQMALAVQYLHSMEIAHRDLKCENILVTANYNVKLADFGFARFVVDSRGRLVLSDTYCGSLSYAAPEVLRGMPYNPKIADLWSLGVILYIMFNKSMPFDDTSLKRLYEQQMNRKWKFRSKVDAVLSEQAKRLVFLLMEPNVTKRGTLSQVLKSDWVAMDPRLLKMSPAEKAAAARAQEERRRIYDGKPNSAGGTGKTGRASSARERERRGGDGVRVIKHANRSPNAAASRKVNV